jgi:CheY-like chemotaxis protein
MEAHQIVVVDSNSRSRMATQSSLEQAGYRLTNAADGAHALEEIERVRPSLFLLNLALPVIESLTVLVDIRYLLGRHIRVVLTGAHASLVRALQSAELHVDGFMETPTGPEQLLQYVGAVLNPTPEIV